MRPGGEPLLRVGQSFQAPVSPTPLTVQKERISVFSLNHGSFHPGPHPGRGTDVGLGQNFLHCKGRPNCGHGIRLVGHSSVCYVRRGIK